MAVGPYILLSAKPESEFHCLIAYCKHVCQYVTKLYFTGRQTNINVSCYIKYKHINGSRDSSVGIATPFGLDGPEIESRWGARFSATVQNGPGAHLASCTMGSGYFPGVKRPERGVNHPLHLAQRIKKEYSYTTTTLLHLHGLF